MSNNFELTREPSKVRDRHKAELEQAAQAVRPLPGSLTEGLSLNAEARQKCVKAMKSGPQFPAALVTIASLSPFSPFSQEAVNRFLSDLEKEDCAEMVRDERGRSLGWRLKLSEE